MSAEGLGRERAGMQTFTLTHCQCGEYRTVIRPGVSPGNQRNYLRKDHRPRTKADNQSMSLLKPGRRSGELGYASRRWRGPSLAAMPLLFIFACLAASRESLTAIDGQSPHDALWK